MPATSDASTSGLSSIALRAAARSSSFFALIQSSTRARAFVGAAGVSRPAVRRSAAAMAAIPRQDVRTAGPLDRGALDRVEAADDQERRREDERRDAEDRERLGVVADVHEELRDEDRLEERDRDEQHHAHREA